MPSTSSLSQKWVSILKVRHCLSDDNMKYEATPILPKWVRPIMPERDRHVRLAVQEGERGGRGKGRGVPSTRRPMNEADRPAHAAFWFLVPRRAFPIKSSSPSPNTQTEIESPLRSNVSTTDARLRLTVGYRSVGGCTLYTVSKLRMTIRKLLFNAERRKTILYVQTNDVNKRAMALKTCGDKGYEK